MFKRLLGMNLIFGIVDFLRKVYSGLLDQFNNFGIVFFC